MSNTMNQIELKKTIRDILDNIDESRRLKDTAESIKDELNETDTLTVYKPLFVSCPLYCN